MFESDTWYVLLKFWSIFTQLYFLLITQCSEVAAAEVRDAKNQKLKEEAEISMEDGDVREAVERERFSPLGVLGHFLGPPLGALL